MIKIANLQSQIALNRAIINELEVVKREGRVLGKYDKKYAVYEHNGKRYYKNCIDKTIKQYAKLQRALKSEIAHKVKCHIKEIG